MLEYTNAQYGWIEWFEYRVLDFHELWLIDNSWICAAAVVRYIICILLRIEINYLFFVFDKFKQNKNLLFFSALRIKYIPQYVNANLNLRKLITQNLHKIS